ncbi:MAG: DUF202 domain-containing protein [Candidatus Micrarchaeota archaeon]
MASAQRLAEIRNDLAEERTQLAWQRNRLSEISVLLGVTGLGLLAARFYENYWQFGAAIAVIGVLWLAVVVFRYMTTKNRMRCL